MSASPLANKASRDRPICPVPCPVCPAPSCFSIALVHRMFDSPWLSPLLSYVGVLLVLQVKNECYETLKKLGIDCLDLYYLHRADPDTPIEDTVPAFKELIDEGKIR